MGKVGEEAAEEALEAPNFDQSLEKLVEKQMSDLNLLYVGDLADGEAYDPELISILEINDWSIIGLNEEWVTLILNIKAEISVEVQYEDRDEAIYDKEDDVYFGAEIASRNLAEEIEIQYLVEVKRSNGAARNGELLTREASIRGPFDYD